MPQDSDWSWLHALLNALAEAARQRDQRTVTCHPVRADIDVLLSEVPFHFRRPDLALFRCVEESRVRSPLPGTSSTNGFSVG
jgi:hypothetical protein